MLDPESLRVIGIAAKVGAEELDRVKPEWPTLIDPAVLDMGNANACILGQVFKEEGSKHRNIWKQAVGMAGYDYAFVYDKIDTHLAGSFNNPTIPNLHNAHQPEIWSALGEAWIREAKKRLDEGIKVG